MNITEKLFEMQDLKYRDFHARLIPDVSKETIIGVRTPSIRKLAKELVKNGEYADFISELPHRYYDENQLHAYILNEIGDFSEAVQRLEEFLPFVDNWATCDAISPKAFRKNTSEILIKCEVWLSSEEIYTVRFGVNVMMKFFLDENFKSKYLYRIAEIKSDEYYVNMGIAWYFATALAKHYEEALPLIENKLLCWWVHNKTIQKAIESYRVSDVQKEYLRTLKV